MDDKKIKTKLLDYPSPNNRNFLIPTHEKNQLPHTQNLQNTYSQAKPSTYLQSQDKRYLEFKGPDKQYSSSNFANSKISQQSNSLINQLVQLAKSQPDYINQKLEDQIQKIQNKLHKINSQKHQKLINMSASSQSLLLDQSRSLQQQSPIQKYQYGQQSQSMKKNNKSHQYKNGLDFKSPSIQADLVSRRLFSKQSGQKSLNFSINSSNKQPKKFTQSLQYSLTNSNQNSPKQQPYIIGIRKGISYDIQSEIIKKSSMPELDDSRLSNAIKNAHKIHDVKQCGQNSSQNRASFSFEGNPSFSPNQNNRTLNPNIFDKIVQQSSNNTSQQQILANQDPCNYLAQPIQGQMRMSLGQIIYQDNNNYIHMQMHNDSLESNETQLYKSFQTVPIQRHSLNSAINQVQIYNAEPNTENTYRQQKDGSIYGNNVVVVQSQYQYVVVSGGDHNNYQSLKYVSSIQQHLNKRNSIEDPRKLSYSNSQSSNQEATPALRVSNGNETRSQGQISNSSNSSRSSRNLSINQQYNIQGLCVQDPLSQAIQQKSQEQEQQEQKDFSNQLISKRIINNNHISVSDNKINIYETPVSHSHDSHDNHNLKHIEISEYDNSYEGLYNEPEFKRYKSYNEEVIKDNNLNQNRHSNFINSKIQQKNPNQIQLHKNIPPNLKLPSNGPNLALHTPTEAQLANTNRNPGTNNLEVFRQEQESRAMKYQQANSYSANMENQHDQDHLSFSQLQIKEQGDSGQQGQQEYRQIVRTIIQNNNSEGNRKIASKYNQLLGRINEQKNAVYVKKAQLNLSDLMKSSSTNNNSFIVNSNSKSNRSDSKPKQNQSNSQTRKQTFQNRTTPRSQKPEFNKIKSLQIPNNSQFQQCVKTQQTPMMNNLGHWQERISPSLRNMNICDIRYINEPDHDFSQFNNQHIQDLLYYSSAHLGKDDLSSYEHGGQHSRKVYGNRQKQGKFKIVPTVMYSCNTKEYATDEQQENMYEVDEQKPNNNHQNEGRNGQRKRKKIIKIELDQKNVALQQQVEQNRQDRIRINIRKNSGRLQSRSKTDNLTEQNNIKNNNKIMSNYSECINPIKTQLEQTSTNKNYLQANPYIRDVHLAQKLYNNQDVYVSMIDVKTQLQDEDNQHVLRAPGSQNQLLDSDSYNIRITETKNDGDNGNDINRSNNKNMKNSDNVNKSSKTKRSQLSNKNGNKQDARLKVSNKSAKKGHRLSALYNLHTQFSEEDGEQYMENQEQEMTEHDASLEDQQGLVNAKLINLVSNGTSQSMGTYRTGIQEYNGSGSYGKYHKIGPVFANVNKDYSKSTHKLNNTNSNYSSFNQIMSQKDSDELGNMRNNNNQISDTLKHQQKKLDVCNNHILQSIRTNNTGNNIYIMENYTFQSNPYNNNKNNTLKDQYSQYNGGDSNGQTIKEYRYGSEQYYRDKQPMDGSVSFSVMPHVQVSNPMKTNMHVQMYRRVQAQISSNNTGNNSKYNNTYICTNNGNNINHNYINNNSNRSDNFIDLVVGHKDSEVDMNRAKSGSKSNKKLQLVSHYNRSNANRNENKSASRPINFIYHTHQYYDPNLHYNHNTPNNNQTQIEMSKQGVQVSAFNPIRNPPDNNTANIHSPHKIMQRHRYTSSSPFTTNPALIKQSQKNQSVYSARVQQPTGTPMTHSINPLLNIPNTSNLSNIHYANWTNPNQTLNNENSYSMQYYNLLNGHYNTPNSSINHTITNPNASYLNNGMLISNNSNFSHYETRSRDTDPQAHAHPLSSNSPLKTGISKWSLHAHENSSKSKNNLRQNQTINMSGGQASKSISMNKSKSRSKNKISKQKSVLVAFLSSSPPKPKQIPKIKLIINKNKNKTVNSHANDNSNNKSAAKFNNFHTNDQNRVSSSEGRFLTSFNNTNNKSIEKIRNYSKTEQDNLNSNTGSNKNGTIIELQLNKKRERSHRFISINQSSPKPNINVDLLNGLASKKTS